jgi:hypothetical protein
VAVRLGAGVVGAEVAGAVGDDTVGARVGVLPGTVDVWPEEKTPVVTNAVIRAMTAVIRPMTTVLVFN